MATTISKVQEQNQPTDFLIKDYDLKIAYLNQHFTRMWTRFNYFVGIESALVGGKIVFGDGKMSPEVAIVGAVVASVWYIMGAEDRHLVRIYRTHVKDAADLIAKAVWDPHEIGSYIHVGEVENSSRRLRREFSSWRIEAISTTRLAAWIPLLVLVAWVGLLLA